MEPGDDDAAGAVERDALSLEEGALHHGAALETAEAAAGPNGPVTWHNERERVRGQGVAHGPRSFRPAEAAGDEPIGADAAPGNGVLGAQHGLLERGTRRESDEIERESNGITRQKGPYRIRQGVDLPAGSRPGIREESGRLGRGVRARPRKKHADDLRLPVDRGPHQDDGPEGSGFDRLAVHETLSGENEKGERPG